MSDDFRKRKNSPVKSINKSNKSDAQYVFDQETMNMMMSGKRFQLQGDYRFTELPELIKFRAKKLTNQIGKGLSKQYKSEYEKAKIEIDR